MFSRHRRRIALAEAGAVFALIMLYIWQVRFTHPRFWWVILCLMVASHAVRRETWARLGFRRAGFLDALRSYHAPVVLLSLVLFAAGSLCRSFREIPTESGFFSLALYCFWGLFQQYLVNGYFVNRLEEAGLGPRATALAAGSLFALAHLPNWFLMTVGLPGGYAAARAFERHRNLYFLGLVHAWFGFLVYLVAPDWLTRHMYVGPKWFGH